MLAKLGKSIVKYISILLLLAGLFGLVLFWWQMGGFSNLTAQMWLFFAASVGALLLGIFGLLKSRRIGRK